MRDYIDQSLVEEIATQFDPDHQLTKSNVLNFRSLFKERIASFHLIPCRVCFSFSHVRILFIDDVNPHLAVALCSSHYAQFKNYYYYAASFYYAASLMIEECPNVAEELAVYPLAEEVVLSLIDFDKHGFFKRKKLKITEEQLPITVNLEHCDFFLDHKIRDTLLKKIRRGKIKLQYKSDIERIINESTRVYQTERFSFIATPWETIEWYEPLSSRINANHGEETNW